MQTEMDESFILGKKKNGRNTGSKNSRYTKRVPKPKEGDTTNVQKSKRGIFQQPV